jgi:NTE family protein
MPIKKKKPKLKIGLALSGGGALGIAHIGALKALQESKIKISYISGTSAGAVVAACWAFGISTDEMIEISKKLNWLKISNFGYSKLGLNSNKPVGKIIKDYIGDKNIEDAKIPLAIIATDIDSGKKVIFREGNLAEAVMASACIPVFFAPVEIGKRKLVDGMLVENVPFSPLKRMGAQLEVGVDLTAKMAHEKTEHVLDVVNNAYGIFARQQQVAFEGSEKIIIEPHLEKFTLFDFKNPEQLIDAGFTATKLVVPEIKRRLKQEQSEVKSLLDKIGNFFDPS